MRNIVLIFIGAALATACGAMAQFNYRYYAVDAVKYEGFLRGPTADKDLPFTVCQPIPGKAAPCLAMMKDQYLALKADYLDLQTKLAACQRGK